MYLDFLGTGPSCSFKDLKLTIIMVNCHMFVYEYLFSKIISKIIKTHIFYEVSKEREIKSLF